MHRSLQLNHNFYEKTAAFIFVAVGILHGLRAFYEWELIYNGWHVPLWISWLVVLVAFLMALTGLRRI